MILTLRASTSQLPQISRRNLSQSVRMLAKAPLVASAETPTPLDLLTKIGRGAEKRLAGHAESWEKLSSAWQKGREGIKDSGLNVKDRRYVLWAFAKYSQGAVPSTFIRPPTPPKKIRGWGPRVQDGVRVK